MSEPTAKRSVLIDDDAAFRLLLKTAAKAQGLEMEAFESLSSLGRVGRLGEFDVVVIDYHIDAVSGLDISRYIEAFLGCKTPVVLVSASRVEELRSVKWPACVKRVIPKEVGLKAIIDAALEEANGLSTGQYCVRELQPEA